jgi:hypothetical protein
VEEAMLRHVAVISPAVPCTTPASATLLQAFSHEVDKDA